jgi:beta-catenin-like protein 1
MTFSIQRFIDSEADLDSAIKTLLPLAQAPVLAYPELVRSGTVTLLIGLLSHENADIVIDVVEVVHELTDEDVGNEADDEGDGQNAEDALKILIEGLVYQFSSLSVPEFTIVFTSWRTPFWNSWLTTWHA